MPMRSVIAAAPARRLLTTPEAMRYVGASDDLLYDRARRGELHPVRLGPRCTRWDLADLDAWIARCAAGAAGGAA